MHINEVICVPGAAYCHLKQIYFMLVNMFMKNKLCS